MDEYTFSYHLDLVNTFRGVSLMVVIYTLAETPRRKLQVCILLPLNGRTLLELMPPKQCIEVGIDIQAKP